MDAASQPPQGPGVSEWYAGRTILVTGGTGFIGKVLLEKLLYSCSDIECILVLVRPKRDCSPQLRLQTMLDLPLFERLRSEKPEVLSKVRVLEGDITEPELGLSELDLLAIQQTVSLVFHCAASLHMETNLKVAVNNNVLSTHRLLDLAETITNLEVFVHVSTAFCHCDREVMDEVLYPPPISPQKVIKMVQMLDSEEIEALTSRILGQHPNVYTFTKCLSEALVGQRASRINAVVARPSIVLPAWKDPMPGWVDSLNGIVGLTVAAGKGVLRSMVAGGEANIQSIPVDIAVNVLITCAYSAANNRSGSVQVFNVTQGDIHSMTWGEVMSGFHHLIKTPFEGAVWYPGVYLHKSHLMHTIFSFFLHFLPAYFIDFLLVLTGNKRFMVGIQHRLSAGLRVLEYFTSRKWNFKNANLLALESRLNPGDQQKFRMRVEHQMNIDQYMGTVILGARQYVMKQPHSSIPQARTHINRLYYIHMMFMCSCYALLLWAGFHLVTWLLGSDLSNVS